jgi:hypothetical protein
MNVYFGSTIQAFRRRVTILPTAHNFKVISNEHNADTLYRRT